MKDNTITVSDWISLSSAVVAIIAALTAYLSLIEQRRISAISANFAMLNETESKLADSSSLLQLHGVTQEMMKECDASAEEVIYLLNSSCCGKSICHSRGSGNLAFSPWSPAFAGVTSSIFVFRNRY